jgi:DNA-binding response OmpR family regulator
MIMQVCESAAHPRRSASLAVLVLEDEAMILMALEDVLQTSGHAVKCAINAEQALALIQTHALDLAVIDVGLRWGDPLVVAAALTARNVPILFCTSGMESLGGPHIAAAVLRKPFSDLELLDAIAIVAAKRHLQ